MAAAVYVSGFLLAPGTTAFDLIQSPPMAQSKTTALVSADPQVVGALRIDPRSADPAYLALLKENFYADVDDAVFSDARARMHPDEPIGVFLQPSLLTPSRFGSVPRHFVRTSDNDHTIVPLAQAHMIRQADAAFPHPTVVHHLDTGHSPYGRTRSPTSSWA